MTEHEYMKCKNEEIEVRLQFYREHKILATARGQRYCSCNGCLQVRCYHRASAQAVDGDDNIKKA